MDTKKKVAWMVSNYNADAATIVFHHHALAARRIGANEIDYEFDDVEIKRAKEFDNYAEQGEVPKEAMMENGWWFECRHCGSYVREEMYDGDDNLMPFEDVVVDGNSVYCNQSCVDSHEVRVKDHNRKFEEFKYKCLEKFPYLSFTDFSGGWPMCGSYAKFTFPGAEYGGSVQTERDSDKLVTFISKGDLPVWEAFVLSRKGAT